MRYWVVVVTRNGAANLPRTLGSLLDQSCAAKRITVVDDGSTDRTQNILRRYTRINHNLFVFTKPNRGYDIRRVPANINLAWVENADLATEYFMISGDDCVYPRDYAAFLLARMNANTQLVVASGRPTTGGHQLQEHSPSGSGRMIRSSFWREVGGAYPLRAGWETWLLYKARERGRQVQLFDNLTYEHARPRGTGHQFVYWGAAMGTLGYERLYAFGRIMRNILIRSVGVTGSVNMLRGYIQSQLGSDDPFISPFDDSLREFVKNTQRQRIERIVATTIGRS
jgi:Glycosyl transferase family 2